MLLSLFYLNDPSVDFVLDDPLRIDVELLLKGPAFRSGLFTDGLHRSGFVEKFLFHLTHPVFHGPFRISSLFVLGEFALVDDSSVDSVVHHPSGVAFELFLKGSTFGGGFLRPPENGSGRLLRR